MKRPYLRLGSDSVMFDGNVAVCWFVDMTNNVDSPRFKNITPGVLYTFVFYQDAEGGNTFTWPNYIINPPEVSTAKNAVTALNFIGMSGEKISNATGTRTTR